MNYTFSVSASDNALAELISRLYEPFSTDTAPNVHYSIVEWDAAELEAIVIYANSALARSVTEPDIALAHLVWDVNQSAIASAGDRWLVHAAAAELDGQAVLLSAPSGSGKSTLVASLVNRGCRYLTDDVAVLEPRTSKITPYPKPIGFARSARQLLPDLAPIAPAFDRYTGAHGFLTARDLGGSIGSPSALRSVVLPTFAPGAETSLVPISTSEAAVALVDQTFSLASTPQSETAGELREIVASCSCYRLCYSDLDTATGLLLSVVF